MTDISTSKAIVKKNRRTLLALAIGRFIDQGEVQAISVLFPTLQKLWGLSYANLGTLGTIRYVLQSVTAPVWGYAADKYSRKKVIIFGTGVWGLWTLICGLTQDFGQLLVIRAISGIGLGSTNVVPSVGHLPVQPTKSHLHFGQYTVAPEE